MKWLRIVALSWLVASSAAISVEESVSVLRNEEPALRSRVKFLQEFHPPPTEQVQLTLDVDYYEQYDTLKKRYLASKMSDNQTQALSDLQYLADHDDVDAVYTLAQINLFGNFSLPTNATNALHYYEKMTQLSDNSTAKYMLGFIYATGLFGKVEMDQGKALLYYQLAADQGNVKAALALAYRYSTGLSVAINTKLALYYYNFVANECFNYLKESPIGGPNIDKYNFRVYDLHGGLYGSGASDVASSVPLDFQKVVDIEEYADIGFQSASYKDQVNSVKNAYQGSYWRPRDYDKAFEIAHDCASQGIQLKVVNEVLEGHVHYYKSNSPALVQSVGQCCANLGHMYLRGEGTAKDFDKARVWLERGNKLCRSSENRVDLGLLYELQGTPEYTQKAYELYSLEAQVSPKALYHKAMLDAKTDVLLAKSQILRAAERGSIEAMYQLVQYDDREGGYPDNYLVRGYKRFVESVEPVVCDLSWAFHQLLNRNLEQALIGYAMAAEQGFENAQASAAYLLYSPVGYLEEPPRVPYDRFQSALNYYSRASRQLNMDAEVFLGDIHYHGLKKSQVGDAEDGDGYVVEPDYELAASYYESAAKKGARQARFNLGYMYEMGIGLAQDFHLAKRYYDGVYGPDMKPTIPAQLALIRLWIKTWWYGEKVSEENMEEEKGRTWDDWIQMYKRLRNERAPDPVEEPLHHWSRKYEGEDYSFEASFDISNSDMLFLAVFVTIFALVMVNRWRLLRQQGEDGPGENRNDDQNARFRIILL
ncbi:hypothetical protein OGAPHI_001182 [Ogataea philodendri]|uniref:ERAD-associated E3 ubiquitin-protein ligase component HRD3 n=1 Tax=Ogataea philodendri TaxID=1378263 RepID=A0A9P8PEQ9_9ASCO|nr:uncharacterized protein OGAPHI_001182 [Ogataea philodendri]KAH3670667.1 hypothetical protein OGAPHI_001182 [Ogataea philodendri]